MVLDLNLSSKVTFIDVLPYNEMMKYTRQCFLGLIFEKIYFTDQHMFALPNKLFDYINAGIPVLSSKAVRNKMINRKYEIGDFIKILNLKKLQQKLWRFQKMKDQYNSWKQKYFTGGEKNSIGKMRKNID